MFDNGSKLIRDGVYDQLRADILTCVFAPGTRIYENELAGRYEVSKSPVRDALLRLQEQGLVEVLPRIGYQVRPISLADARDLYELRIMLEKTCARKAVELAGDDELKALDRFRSADAEGGLAEWVSYNRDFHRAIADCCGNARLAKMTQDVIDQFDRLTFVGVSSSRTEAASENLIDEHCRIIDALQARDKSRVSVLVTTHIKKSQKRFFAVLKNAPIVD